MTDAAKKTTASLEALRRRAEARLRGKPPVRAGFHGHDVNRLVLELETHRIELELQNDELLEAQAALQRTLNRYFELYDLAPVGYATLDWKGLIREVNLAASRLLDCERASLVDRPLAAFMGQSDADTLHRHLQEVRADGSKHGCDLELRTAEGRRLPVHLESIAAVDPAGNPTGCRSVIVDLTDLRRAEQQQRASQARAQTVLDTATDAIVTADETGRIESFNRAAERMFGRSADEVLGENIRMLMPSPYREDHDDYLRRFLETGQGRIIGQPNRVVVGQRKDGSTFPLSLGIAEWRDGGERRFTAVMSDITERQRREEELRESEERFRQIAEHVGDAYAIRERGSGHIVYASPSFEALLGMPADKVAAAGDAWLEWVVPEDRDRVTPAYERACEGAPFDEEYRVRRTDGDIRWFRGRMFPVHGQDGSVQRSIAVVQDVTARHELEDELLQAQKMEAIGALATGVAHDFNNVLQGLLGCINVARSEHTPPERAREYLDRAAEVARRGGELAGQLTAFARREAPDPRPLRIDDLVQGVAPLLGRLATERITVRVDLRAPSSTIVADRVQVEQLLMNLAANARDAMPAGGSLTIRTEEITVDERQPNRTGRMKPGRYVRLSVEDTGIGMDASTQARIFEPFFTTKDVGKGTGLGLSTVFAITRQMCGHVDVDTEPDHGTTFTFFFPCSDEAQRAAAESVRFDTRLAGTALLVEDDPVVRATTRHELKELGLTVLQAEDASEALELCKMHRGLLDVLVSDVALPGSTGPEFASLLRERFPDLPVLFVTATPEVVESLGAQGARTAVLRKPFDGAQLADELVALMGTEAVVHRAPSERFPAPVAEHRWDARALERAGEPTAARRDRDQETILLVDDDAVSTAALRLLMEEQGYRVAVAGRPSEAFEAMAASPEDITLVVTDVKLPEMSGMELAARLHESHPDLPVVFMSGFPEAPAGASAFVRKPVDVDGLLRVIEDVLAGGSAPSP